MSVYRFQAMEENMSKVCVWVTQTQQSEEKIEEVKRDELRQEETTRMSKWKSHLNTPIEYLGIQETAPIKKVKKVQ